MPHVLLILLHLVSKLGKLLRPGGAKSDAQDMTQEFFSRLLANRGLATVDPAKGRFRSFLLVSLKNVLANEWNRARTQKRGGGATLFSLNEKTAEAVGTYFITLKKNWGHT